MIARRVPGRAAIFLDKDGTILDDEPYNVDPMKMRYAPRAESALRRLGRLEMPLVVITNQPGIAHAFFDVDALQDVEDRLATMFARCGATLHAMYACPHHPKGRVPQYACACLCRKPMPGLLRRAAVDHDIDLKRSWFVGDILDDVEAGRRAGCRTILVDNGNETEWHVDPRNAYLRTPDHVVRDIEAAACIIDGSASGPTRGPDVETLRRGAAARGGRSATSTKRA